MIRLLGMVGVSGRPPCQATGLSRRNIMGLRFRKRFKLFPGVFINVSKSGLSTTLKAGPVSHTTGHGRKTTSVNLPGPFGWTKTTRKGRQS